MTEEINQVLSFMKGIMPAIAGGLARYLHVMSKKDEPFLFRVLLAQILISAIVGTWALGLSGSIEYFELNPGLKGSFIGVCSFLSPNILDFLLDMFPKMAKKYFNKNFVK